MSTSEEPKFSKGLNFPEGFRLAQDKRYSERMKGIEPLEGGVRFSLSETLERAKILADRASAFTYTEMIIEMNRILRGK